MVVLSSLVILTLFQGLVWGGEMNSTGEDSTLFALIPQEERLTLIEALTSAGTNRGTLERAVKEAGSEEVRRMVIELILRMPPADRAEVTMETLLDHAGNAFEARRSVRYTAPDEVFFDYVLNFRLDFEAVTAWRKELFRMVFPVIRDIGDASTAAQLVNRWVAEQVSEIPLHDLRQAPLETLRSGRGSSVDLAILTGAALRAVCLPARVVYVYALGEKDGGAAWVEVFGDRGWIPVYPLVPEAFGDTGWLERDHPHNITKVTTQYGPYQEGAPDTIRERRSEDVTLRYTATGRLSVTVKGADEKGQIAVSVFNSGSWVPIAYGHRGEFVLGDGEYLITAGQREGKIMMKRVRIEPGKTTVVTLE